MKKNLYYRTVYKRQNVLKKFFLNLFLSISSYPRLILEVFIRRNMGERYFTLASAITVSIILLLIPYMADSLFSFLMPSSFRDFSSYGRYGNDSSNTFWKEYATWYIFTLAFMYFSYVRWQEVKRNPSVYDFARFSLSAGNILPIFQKYGVSKGQVNQRRVETLIEPLPFFVVGLLLYLLDQKVGMLLMVCAVVYSFSYLGAYSIGDNFVMDKIDEKIMNEELKSAFVDDVDPSKTRGVRFYPKKPNSIEDREALVESFIEDSDDDYPEAS